MIQEKGSVSVKTENIFPIIRKWLYSDHDIFLRELVSNAADALSKMKRLATLGEASVPEGTAWRIDVVEDKEKGTLSISDNGRGIEKENLDKIFIPFFSTENRRENWGLGLSYCYRVIMAH